jgi:glycosyltransferase involved in cell wall biosynthesis
MTIKKKIAVIASRFKTIDDEAIEAEKWIDKYLRLGYEVHLIGGKFGEPTNLPKLEIPVMDYKHSEIRGIKRIMFGNALDKSGIKAANILLNPLVNKIYIPIKKYLSNNKINIISVENALGNLKNPALNIALTKLIKDSGLPTISKQHTFFWDKQYFEKNKNFPELLKNTPPNLKNIIFITNSTNAQAKLLEKKNLKSIVIPNTIDIGNLQKKDEYNKDFREAFDVREDQLLFLQPTRINRRKGIETSIKIVKEINEATKKDNVLMITGPPVYFRGNYFEEIVRKINKSKVNVILAHDRIFISRHQNKEQKFYSIADAYLHADMVMFPSLNEDFGLPVLYAMAYKRPLFVNNHANLKDVLEKKPKFILRNNKITCETISDVFEILHDKEKKNKIINHNFEILKKYYGSDLLDDKIIPLLNKFEKKSFINKLKNKFIKTKKRFTKEDKLKNKKGSYKEPKKNGNVHN